ncbi:SAM-dependent methyltransferase [Corallococcus praedator]|uniref:SAM-dependent methyltransferase n=1 Tax=Corallococcus praedator TaxID=2316724 RepID=A0ABX9QEX2_9BACT|nr:MULTISPECIES: SAM-dependent methyltransferase [Corallococcus]RKH07603.1 SAM-dependent methyltransferase [Corallococcus sp. CA047B]RKH32736.1 SAM-dependent methyltransferase [Corallococcus sp. CA031C]RKI05677.1 SAM-dependent methyltransferase [Corallococcus praedator]
MTDDARSGTAGVKRTVYCEDALAWLDARPVLEGCSVIASMPDVSEFPSLTVAQWKDWFVGAAARVLSRVPEDGVAVFYQSDVKKDGAWVDKGYLVSKAAEAAGCETLWHKVVCRRTPGTVTFGRPAYSHLLCFSRGLKADAGKSTADVLPEAGEVTWTRGMGLSACLVACRFILEQTRTRTVVDPFCGHGTALAVANALGLDAVGVELSRKRARRARNLQATWNGSKLVLSGTGGGEDRPDAPDED